MRYKYRWFLNEGQEQMVSQRGARTDGSSMRGKCRWFPNEGSTDGFSMRGKYRWFLNEGQV
jgi:hypothetical protein